MCLLAVCSFAEESEFVTDRHSLCIQSQEKYYVNKWYRWKSESLEIYRDNNNSIWTLDSVITI